MNTKKHFVCPTNAAALSVAAMALGMGGAGALAAESIPYSVAEVFIELNDSDGDLGLHSLVDGDPWSKLEIKGPNNKRLLKTQLSGKLKQQGLTEFFFESAEPTFDELSPAEFFHRFPEGMYKVKGRTLEGEQLEAKTEFTHNVPAPAVTSLNGIPDTATECDEDEAGYDPTELEAPVTISWEPVTTTHPDLDGVPQGPVSIVNYELVVEIEVEVNGEDFDSKFSVILPPDITSVEVPDDFTGQADGHVKYEVLAREESYNQTAVESCFVVGEEE